MDVSHAQAGKLLIKALALRAVSTKLLKGVSRREAFEASAEFIEMSEGTIKQWELENCKYTIACLRENVSKSFGVENLRLHDIVQKFCRKVANFHTVYDAGLTGAEAVDAQEKYKSHRRSAPSEFVNPK
ncbi:unnamed protein product [Ectocarpus sp. CCAP 1310/34]|nr:unnamed protein product [Ectocarpus sp. CCAP 1310/34]